MTNTIGFVVPRYGVEVVGGAERLVRAFAEELHQRGYPVEVFTTCAADMVEWRNVHEPGTTIINGVPVHRFLIDALDMGQVHRTTRVAIDGDHVPYHEQIAYISNSINSQSLYQALREREATFRCFVFAPYLFGTTYWGMQAIPEKAIIIPCLHDEPVAHLTIYRELLEQARGVIFNAEGEQSFALEKLKMLNPEHAVVGYGFDLPMPQGNAQRFRQERGLNAPILLYVGRLQSGKNVPLLVKYFVRYKTERPGPLTLALGGEGEVVNLARPDIVELGFLSEEQKRDAFAAAELFCQPSVNESFSIVLMEAWLQGTPALVHADCAVTREHVATSGGGWSFDSYESFRDALDAAFASTDERRTRGEQGRRYVQDHYTWEAVIGRLTGALDHFLRETSLYEQVARRGIRRAMDFSQERFDDAFGQVIALAEADLAQGISHTQVEQLRNAARVGMPEYRVRSNAPYLGSFIARARQNLTSHLREPYLDPIVERQEAYNQMVLDAILPVLDRSIRSQQRLERQVRLLEQQLAALREQSNDGGE